MYNRDRQLKVTREPIFRTLKFSLPDSIRKWTKNDFAPSVTTNDNFLKPTNDSIAIFTPLNISLLLDYSYLSFKHHVDLINVINYNLVKYL